MTTLRPIGRRTAIKMGLAGAAAALAPRRARAQNPREVKIALVVPLSGPWARQGILEQMGAELAIEDVNSSGGIKALGGAKLKLVLYDTGDSAEKAKNAAQRLVAQEPDVVGGIGCWLSSFTLAVTEVTERAELPWLTLSYSDLITGRGFKYIFQSSPTAEAQATALLPRIVDLATKAGAGKPDQGGLRRRQLGFFGQLHEADPRPRGEGPRPDDRGGRDLHPAAGRRDHPRAEDPLRPSGLHRAASRRTSATTSSCSTSSPSAGSPPAPFRWSAAAATGRCPSW